MLSVSPHFAHLLAHCAVFLAHNCNFCDAHCELHNQYSDCISIALHIGDIAEEEYCVAHSERWILSPHTRGSLQRASCFHRCTAHTAQQCPAHNCTSSAQMHKLSLHSAAVLFSTMPHTQFHSSVFNTYLHFFHNCLEQSWRQSKRHWALGKSECSDLPKAKINTRAEPPMCATSSSRKSSLKNPLARSHPYIIYVLLQNCHF